MALAEIYETKKPNIQSKSDVENWRGFLIQICNLFVPSWIVNDISNKHYFSLKITHSAN